MFVANIAPAEAQRDSGAFNIPLFPEGPTLSTIGSVALGVLTGGMGAASILANAGYNLAVNGINALTDKYDYTNFGTAMVETMKSMVTDTISYGTGQWSSGFNGMSDFGSKMMATAGVSMVNSTLSSAVNAFQLQEDGSYGWNASAFGIGATQGVVGAFNGMMGSVAEYQFHTNMGGKYSQAGQEGHDKYYGWTYTAMEYEAGSTRQKLYDFFQGDILYAGSFVNNMTAQMLGNATGLQDGVTFNFLNAGDLGLGYSVNMRSDTLKPELYKNAKGLTGILGLTLGGDSLLSLSLTNSGFDISDGKLQKLINGFVRAKVYKDNAVNGSDSDKAAYVADNLLYYVQEYGKNLTAEQQENINTLIDDLDKYLTGEMNLRIVFGDGNEKIGENTIMLDKKLVESMSTSHEGIIQWNMTDASIFTALLGHESRHDGENTVNQEDAKKGQELLAKDPSMSEEDLTNKLIAEGYTEEEAANIAGELYEDIGAFQFQASIWGGLKNTFGVSNFENDQLLLFYNTDNDVAFKILLTAEFSIGRENFSILNTIATKKELQAYVLSLENKLKNEYGDNLEDLSLSGDKAINTMLSNISVLKGFLMGDKFLFFNGLRDSNLIYTAVNNLANYTTQAQQNHSEDLTDEIIIGLYDDKSEQIIGTQIEAEYDEKNNLLDYFFISPLKGVKKFTNYGFVFVQGFGDSFGNNPLQGEFSSENIATLNAGALGIKQALEECKGKYGNRALLQSKLEEYFNQYAQYGLTNLIELNIGKEMAISMIETMQDNIADTMEQLNKLYGTDGGNIALQLLDLLGSVIGASGAVTMGDLVSALAFSTSANSVKNTNPLVDGDSLTDGGENVVNIEYSEDNINGIMGIAYNTFAQYMTSAGYAVLEAEAFNLGSLLISPAEVAFLAAAAGGTLGIGLPIAIGIVALEKIAVTAYSYYAANNANKEAMLVYNLLESLKLKMWDMWDIKIYEDAFVDENGNPTGDYYISGDGYVFDSGW